MADVDVNALLWALGLLSIPLFLALPMRIAWRLFTGTGHEESQYRNTVLQIIDAGRQVAPFRATLDDVARSLHIQPSQQRLILVPFLKLIVSRLLFPEGVEALNRSLGGLKIVICKKRMCSNKNMFHKTIILWCLINTLIVEHPSNNNLKMTNKIKLYTGRILAFWALFVFASTMFLFIWFYLACFFLQEPNKTKWHS